MILTTPTILDSKNVIGLKNIFKENKEKLILWFRNYQVIKKKSDSLKDALLYTNYFDFETYTYLMVNNGNGNCYLISDKTRHPIALKLQIKGTKINELKIVTESIFGEVEPITFIL